MKPTVPFAGFKYHPHQDEAIKWMIEREKKGADVVRGGILADEMGLGKTWTTIGLLLTKPVSNTLLLVPPVLQPQWCEALVKAGISHDILSPPSAKGASGSWRSVECARADMRVTVSTYDRASNNVVLLEPMHFDRIVCDEGHIFRNGGASRRFVKLSALVAKRRWILTGTPVQNRKSDFVNLLKFLGLDGEDVIRARASPEKAADTVMLRRTVGDVRDVVVSMPAFKPTHTVHPVSMPRGGEEEAVFNSLVGRFEHAIEVHAKASIILELYLRIRQFIAHPAIYVEAMRRKFKHTYKRTEWTGTASKMAAFANFLRTTPKAPTIVFGTFKSELDHAEVQLSAAGYKVWSIRGGMSESSREASTTESRKAASEGKPVAIVVQIVAGGAGLNLQHCNRIVFLSSHWNPAMVDQAIARAYRMGQAAAVQVHHLLLADDAEKNLDRYMAAMHGRKRTDAVEVHPKLFCDTAVSADAVLDKLNEALPAERPAAYAYAGAGVAAAGAAPGVVFHARVAAHRFPALADAPYIEPLDEDLSEDE